MFLQDLNPTPKASFDKLNDMLYSCYSLKIKSDDTLDSLYENLSKICNVTQRLRMRGGKLFENEEYSRNVLLMEGLVALINTKEESVCDGKFQLVLEVLSEYIADSVKEGTVPTVVDVMDVYRATGNSTYSTATIRAIVENFLRNIDALSMEKYNIDVSALTHAHAADDNLYGEELVSSFFASRNGELSNKYEPAMLERFEQKLGKS
jgi:hypothetical protein